MTNSPVNETPKKKKPKGPIRTGAVVPTILFIVIVGVFFVFFFDHLMKSAIEYAGTQAVGAEVDIGGFHTNFIAASLEIDGIQVTDKEHPERNLVQVGRVRFKLLWDALLRAKAVVDDASILDIEAYTPRKYPGRVLPPAPPPPPGKPSSMANVEGAVLQQTRKDYNGNFLGDIAGVLGGGDSKEQLKNLQGELKSDAKIKELQKDLDGKKAQWQARIKALPQSKDFQQYNDRIKVLKFDTKNPAQFAKSVQEAQKIVQEASGKVKEIDQAQKDLKTDLGNYNGQIKDIDKLVQQDIHDLQGKLKIPNIDAKEFSQQLFMSMLEKKLGSVFKYVELARKYMPAKQTPQQIADAKKKEAEEIQITPPKRGQGKSYRFPITTGYPLFWLKHAEISSKMDTSDFSGDIKGDIRDVTSDPSYIGRPTVITLQGDFNKQNIHGLDAKITLDHTGDVAKESFNVKVAQFPVTENKLSDSPDVKLALEQAAGSTEMDGTFIDEILTMNMKNSFHDIKYDIEAKNKMVHDILDSVLKGIPIVTVNADVKGSLHNLDIHINSNLGDELSKGFQKQLQAKVAEAQAQLKKVIDDKINGPRKQLMGDMSKTTGDITKEVDGKKAEGDKALKDTQNQASGGSKGGQKQLQDQGKKLLNKFLGG